MLGEHTVPGGLCILCTSLVLADQFPGCTHEGTVSGVLCVSSGDLISGCETPARYLLPGSQEEVLSNWELAHSLVEDEVPGAEIAAPPCLLALAATYLPLCLQGERDIYSSWLSLQ